VAVPTIRAVGAVATGTASVLAVVNPTHAAGDLLLCFAAGANNASATPAVALSSWTQVGTITHSTGTIRGTVAVFAKRAAISAESNAQVSGVPTGTATHYAARTISITAGTWNDTGTLAQAWEDVTTGSSLTAAVNLTGLVTTGPDRLCLAHLFQADNVATAITNDGSYATEGLDSDSATGCDGFLGTRSKAVASAGAAGATFSWTSGGTAAPCLGVAVALIPSAALPPVELSGSAGGVAGGTGTIGAGVVLSGSAAGQASATTSGRPTDVGLGGAAAGQGGGAGALAGIGGSAAGQGGAGATITQVRPLSGVADGAADAVAADPTGVVIGVVTYPTSTTWECQITGLASGANLFTVSDGTDTIEVTVSTPIVLSGAAAGQASGSGAGLSDAHLGGSAGGTAGGSGAPQSQPPMGGSAAGQGGASGVLATLSRSAPSLFVAASAADGSVLTFGLSPFVVRAADGTSIGVNIAPTGYYGPGVALSGSAAGYAGATATGAVGAALVGSAAGQAGAGGTLGAAGVSGTAAGHAGAVATLGQQVPISGTAAGAAGATATGFQFPVPLAGTAAGHADGEATTGKTPLGGPAAGQAGAAGTLTQSQPLSGVAAGLATATGTLPVPPAEGLTHSTLRATPPTALRASRAATPVRATAPTQIKEGNMQNFGSITVPRATNFRHVLEFYESDGTTPRDVSAYTVSCSVAAGSGGAGTAFTVTVAAGSASHTKMLEFTKEQIPVKMDREIRVELDMGGAAGPEDAGHGTLIVR
jgi:hypothetical protein